MRLTVYFVWVEGSPGQWSLIVDDSARRILGPVSEDMRGVVWAKVLAMLARCGARGELTGELTYDDTLRVILLAGTGGANA